MELNIKDYQLPAEIEFNFDELKAELINKTQHYETLVYTDEQIKEAKADKASLNKLKKALNDERIRREKEYLVPFNEFKKKINELIDLIDKPILTIDKQIKGYEEESKAKKRQDIVDYFNAIEDKPAFLSFDAIFDYKWLNATTSMKSIKASIDETIERIKSDLETIEKLPQFSFEAKVVYTQGGFDLNKAIAEGQRLADIQRQKEEAEKAKAEAEAKRKAEEEAKKQAETVAKKTEEAVFDNAPDIAEQIQKEPVEKKQWVCFLAELTVEQAKMLKAFFDSNNITFEAIKEG